MNTVYVKDGIWTLTCTLLKVNPVHSMFFLCARYGQLSTSRLFPPKDRHLWTGGMTAVPHRMLYVSLLMGGSCAGMMLRV